MPVKKQNVVPLLFLHQRRKDFLFATALQSFLSHTESSCFYDLILLSEPVSSGIKIIFAKMLSGFPNVSLRYLNAEMLRNQINERYCTSEILPFLPHVLMHFSKMLVFSSNTLFEKSVLPLFQAELSENEIIPAPYDIRVQVLVNAIYEEAAELPLRKYLGKPLEFFCSTAMMWDFEKYRCVVSQESIPKVCDKLASERKVFEGEALNILCESKYKQVGQEWAVLATNENQRVQCAPFRVYKEYQSAQKKSYSYCI